MLDLRSICVNMNTKVSSNTDIDPMQSPQVRSTFLAGAHYTCCCGGPVEQAHNPIFGSGNATVEYGGTLDHLQ